MSGLKAGFRVAPRSVDVIRALAWNVRQSFGLPDGRINLEQLLEDMHRVGVVVDVLDSSDAPVGHDVEACWIPEDGGTLFIRDTVYADACRGGPRAMFTIGHELGHIALGHRRTINFAESRGLRYPVYENSEWQANTFAAEFLIPLPILNAAGLQTVDEIAAHFGVSRQAAEVRLQKLAQEAASRKIR